MYMSQPHNYKALITPFQQRMLQFGVDDSKIFLSEAANAVFNSFTNGYTPDETDRSYESRNHAILDGGYVEATLDGTSLIKVTLKPTTLVADNVLLVFPEDTTVDCDVEELGDDGEILVFLNYRYIQTVYENRPFIKALYYDNISFTPDEFEPALDSIVLTRISFEKTDGVVTKITSSITDPYKQIKKNFITINGEDIEIAPLAGLWYRIIEGYQNIHARKQTFTIEDPNEWQQEVPTFDIGSPGIFHSVILPIDIVNTKLCHVQCFIDNLMINPTAIQHVSDDEVKIWMPAEWAIQENLPTMSIIVTG